MDIFKQFMNAQPGNAETQQPSATVQPAALVAQSAALVAQAAALLAQAAAMMSQSDGQFTHAGTSTAQAPVPATRPAPTPTESVGPAVPPPPAVAPSSSAGSETLEPVKAPLPGKILSVAVSAGDPVQKGDELCVIEAMKMGNSIVADRDGVVRDVMVSVGDTVRQEATLLTIAVPVAGAGIQRPTRIPTSAPAPTPVPDAVPAGVPQDGVSKLRLGIAGAQHQVELAPGTNGSWKVVLDGAAFEVKRDQAEPKKLVVGGKAHSVEVRNLTASSAFVLIDGEPQYVELSRESLPALQAYSLDLEGASHRVEIRTPPEGPSTVALGGELFQVSGDRSDPKRILVNGKAHTVEIKEVAGRTLSVLIDGVPQKVSLVREASPAVAVSPAPPSAMSVPSPTPPPAMSVPSPTPPPAHAAASPLVPQAPVASIQPRSAPRAPARPAARNTGAEERVVAPLPGKVLSVAVKAGDVVRKGEELCVIESMKMGNSIVAEQDAAVREVLVSVGDIVEAGAPMFILDSK